MTVKGCASHTVSGGKLVYAQRRSARRARRRQTRRSPAVRVVLRRGEEADRAQRADTRASGQVRREQRRASHDASDIRPGRLTEEQIAANFADMHPPLSRSEAIIDADRCYFCYDAPCTTACPTGIDIPGFIQKIRSGNLKGSAHTILSENIMGGMCARVCPTEVLCEQACVRNTHEDQPVRIGTAAALRHRSDLRGRHCRCSNARRRRAARSRWSAAGPRASPARIASRCSGTTSSMFEPKDKLGGLNEYGIAAYKTPDDFAAREVEYILAHRRHRRAHRRGARQGFLAGRPARELRRGVSRLRPRGRQRPWRSTASSSRAW